MTDEESAGQPGALATRSDEDSDTPATEPVFSPKDFKLNLGARLAVSDEEPLTDLDSPSIRKLTWEHVVPDRPASSAPSAATLVPLPPPRRVPPPPPLPVTSFQPPAPTVYETVAEDDEPDDAGMDHDDDDVIDDEISDDEVIDDEVVDGEVEDEVTDEEIVGDELDDEDVDDDDVDDEPVVIEPVMPVVQQEVNRLASVPDLFDDDDTPIELPPITPSGPIVAHAQSVYAPVLAETLYIPAPSRPATTTVSVIGAPEKPKKRKASKKSGLRLFRTFMTLVLLLGLLAGGAFAAKKYLLQELKWSAELKPIADEVAAARGLEFKVPVEMTALPISDYAARLAASVIDPRTVSAPTWRALGLVNGELDLAAVGRQALNDSPAFYDPATETILVSDDLASHEHLYRFAIRRALTAALLDQQFDWGTRVAAASPAAALAIRANIDGDALAVANAMAVNDAPEQLATELSEFVQSHPSAVSPSQYAASIAGRAGAVMRPTVVALANDAPGLAALERATPTNDAAFDAAHPATTVASPAGTQGMMFWYYVLASRIDDAQAWSAAVRWTGDSIATSTGPAGQCVDANITAGDPDGAAVLLVTFTSWANFAPAESGTTVTQAEGNQIAIRACDPGAAVSALAPPKVPVLFGAAGVEHALVQAAAGAAAPGSKIDAACLVTAARGGTATLTAPADEAPVFAVGWKPPYVDANLALATACVAASAG